MIYLDDVDKTILNTIQYDFPLDSRPYKKLGERLGISEDEVIRRLGRLHDEGAVRKIGPVINRNSIGGTSTLVAVNVPDERIDEVASYINEYTEVSHNYLRPDRYNIWFTLSASEKGRIYEILDELKAKTGLEFINLPTKRLFKIGVRFNIR
ncbi:siroheme decarboxylase subunit alpha [Methanolobus halotolerans]|uniref:siroheme decarboxylase n=1 Tax=Methanolobus halotolerans TaxID=2052935 RepID=A0A4E0R134_9EURY|nr:siroheme decarboxylase subunit alpha [Methanolobus halotolerans]TGC10746.1 Lrp/AsnC family transcriptional regulator [Methanolobus halotolerans]